MLFAILAIAIALRLVGLSGRAIHPDEWYHVLAGREWANGEGLRFIRGVYSRVWAYSINVGIADILTGLNGFVAARLPALIFGTGCVGMLALMGRKTASAGVGLLAALLLAIDGMSIEWSQIARFYTLQTLCIMGVAAIAVSWFGNEGPHAQSRGWGRLLRFILPAAVLSVFALHVQVTSLLSLSGIVLYCLLQTRYFRAEFLQTPSRSRTGLFAFTALAIVLFFAALTVLWPHLRETQAWSAHDSANFLYYDDYLRAMYGVFWPLTFFIAVIGWFEYPKAVVLTLCLTFPILFIQSLGGMKAPRYILQVIPFIVLLWSVGLAAAFRFTRRLLDEALPQVARRKAIGAIVLIAVLAFATAGNLAFRQGPKVALQNVREIIAGRSLFGNDPFPGSLRSEIEMLTPLLRADSVLVTTMPPQLAYIGPRSSMHIVNPLNDDGEPLNFDPKTGQIEIATGKELARALGCFAKADVVVMRDQLRSGFLHQDIVTELEKLRESRETGLVQVILFRWTAAQVSNSPECRDLRRRVAASP